MSRPALIVGLLVSAFAPAIAAAQSLGQFRWQLLPYCNTLTVQVVQEGGFYRLQGIDDQCGGAVRAGVVGLAFTNPNGSIGFGFTIVTTPGAQPLHVDATIAITTFSGTWRDSGGNGGDFRFVQGVSVPGRPPRPAAPGGVEEFRADRHLGQAVVPDIAAIRWGAETYNRGGGTYDAAAGTYTVGAAGLYLITANTSWSSSTLYGPGFLCSYVWNASTSIQIAQACSPPPGPNSDFVANNLTTVHRLPAGTVLLILVNQTGAGAVNLKANQDGTHFSVTRLR